MLIIKHNILNFVSLFLIFSIVVILSPLNNNLKINATQKESSNYLKDKSMFKYGTLYKDVKLKHLKYIYFKNNEIKDLKLLPWAVQYKIGKHQTSSIHMSKRFIKGLKEYISIGDNKNSLEKISNEDTQEKTRITVLPKDLKLVNPRNLTWNQKKDLSNFTVSILNSLRKQFGHNKTNFTNGIQRFTDKIADKYSEADWTLPKYGDHDCVAINNLSKKYGMKYFKNNKEQMYESLEGDTLYKYKLVSMASLKANTWFIINDLLFNDVDSDWQHSYHLDGMGYFNDKNSYTATAYDDTGQFHIITVPNSCIKKDYLSISGQHY